jgi:26S proteasome regulatory subunit N10
LGGQLKKNKVAIDIVSFGEDNAIENQPKLEALYKSANNSDNCHIVTVPPGAHMLSEMLQRTPIVRGDAPDTGGDTNYVDDNIDPELAEALRLSMLQAEADNRNREQPKEGEAPKTSSVPLSNNMDEDRELREALRLSMMSVEGQSESGGMLVEEEDDELARAIQLSRETANKDRENDVKAQKEKEEKESKMLVETKETKEEKEETVDMSSVDPEYMSSLFLELPGIDRNDPEVQALLSKMKADTEKKDEKDDKDEKKDEK